MDDKFEILTNPGFSYWEEQLANTYKYEGWVHSIHEYNMWKAAFGDKFNHFVVVDKEVDFEKFMEFDRKITSGLERGDYIKEFFSMQGSYNKVVTSSDDEIFGYCNIRECIDNYLIIGPFYAQNSLAASTVLRAVLESIPNLKNFEILKALAPSNNTDAIKLFETLSTGKFKIGAKNLIQFTSHLMKVTDEKVYSVMDITISYC
uniref:YitH acetyltransferase (GNAT) domain-containing protein n=1 Tax=Acrobeloides nanus TaxID=290746 RepID=A0A914DL47_9BILA